MGWFAGLRTAITVGTEAYRFLRELDAQGKGRLSPRAAERDRRRLERLGLWAHDTKDKGLRRLVSIDDELAQYIASVLKSANLYAVLHGGMLAQVQARQAILDGAAVEVVDASEWQGPAGDRGQP
jgi:hypothetical protein